MEFEGVRRTKTFDVKRLARLDYTKDQEQIECLLPTRRLEPPIMKCNYYLIDIDDRFIDSQWLGPRKAGGN